MNKKTVDEGLYLTTELVQSKDDPDKLYRAKIISKKKLTKERVDKMREQLEILSNMEHPNIMRYHVVMEDRKKLYIISEILKKTHTLREVIRDKLRKFDGKSLLLIRIFHSTGCLYEQTTLRCFVELRRNSNLGDNRFVRICGKTAACFKSKAIC